jgi:hypothetical protein
MYLYSLQIKRDSQKKNSQLLNGLQNLILCLATDGLITLTLTCFVEAGGSKNNSLSEFHIKTGHVICITCYYASVDAIMVVLT